MGTARLDHGKLHGPVRVFHRVSLERSGLCSHKAAFEQGASFVGYFEGGLPSGLCWRGLIGGSWLVGTVDQRGEFTGDDVAYVYGDMRTAFVGKFDDGTMVKICETISTRFCFFNILNFSPDIRQGSRGDWREVRRPRPQDARAD